MAAATIIIPGDRFAVNDYMCHKQLGGCGCVFTSEKIIVYKDSDGDTIESYVTCPTCRKNVSIKNYNGEITYRRVYKPVNTFFDKF